MISSRERRTVKPVYVTAYILASLLLPVPWREATAFTHRFIPRRCLDNKPDISIIDKCANREKLLCCCHITMILCYTDSAKPYRRKL